MVSLARLMLLLFNGLLTWQYPRASILVVWVVGGYYKCQRLFKIQR